MTGIYDCGVWEGEQFLLDGIDKVLHGPALKIRSADRKAEQGVAGQEHVFFFDIDA